MRSTNNPRLSRGWKIVFIVIAVLFVLSIIGSMSSPSTNNTASPGSAVNPAPAAEAKPAEPQTPKTWHKVIELSGNASKRSDVFHLEGGKQRIVYSLDGTTYPSLSVYIMDAGKQLMKDGGFPEVSTSMPGETMSYRGAGDVYLETLSANTSWTVVLDELR
jgi:hypothetical protein